MISYLSQLQNNQNNANNTDSSADTGRGLEDSQTAGDSPDVSTAEPSMAQVSRDQSQAPVAVDPDMANVDPDISNPFREPDRIFQLDQASQQQFVGESTCLAFGDRILQCLNPQSTTASLPPDRGYVTNPAFARQFSSVANCKFPERIRANLLVRVALRFIGQDYHFFLHDDFLQKLERAYDTRHSPEYTDSVWACKFFAVLALGEMYSTSLPAAKETRPTSVPGTGYFLTAVSLLQDLFEEPSVAQIENLLLFVSHTRFTLVIMSVPMTNT